MQHYVKNNEMILIFCGKWLSFKGSYNTEEYKKENSS